MKPGLRRVVLSIRIAPSTLHFEIVRRGKAIWESEASYTDRADVAAAIARVVAQAPVRCACLKATLARPPAQLRTLVGVPPVKSCHLKSLVENQAARYFRRNGRPLATDAVWVAIGTTRAVRAAAVEEPLLEAVVTGARSAGLALDHIGLEGESVPLRLLPSSERVRRLRAAGRRVRRLSFATVVIWMATGILFGGRLARERRAVEHDLASLQGSLNVVLAARRELKSVEAALNAIQTSERVRGRSIALLAAITGAMPDSAVLTRLAWSDAGGGVIGGVARHGADFIDALARSSAVPSPRLDGALVRDGMGGRNWERFTVSFGSEVHD